ncbi:MAG TPA: hypothetical protein VFA50_20645 [Stellaceae bacterium]|nr:hypothetical protein [Stellaceae bacterium]
MALDELESEEDNRKSFAIIKLIRQAASGGLVLRGGADHSGAEFTARSSFLCSSVLVPPLQGADRSRIAILELKEFGQEKPPELLQGKMRDCGRQLLRRLVDGWPRWADTLGLYRGALAEVGHGARGADVFGTMLAAADLLVDDELPHSDVVAELAEQLARKTLAETEDDAHDQERCLQHLLTSPLPPDGPNKRSTGEWIRRACTASHWEVGVEEAVEVLGTYGLKVVRDREGKAVSLAVANYHVGLARLFNGTHWAGKSGASSVWKQALRRLPGAESAPTTVRFASATSKATLLPIELVLPPRADDDYPRPAAPPIPTLG